MQSAQGSDLAAPIFGDLSQSEKLSEINPTLKRTSVYWVELKQENMLVDGAKDVH